MKTPARWLGIFLLFAFPLGLFVYIRQNRIEQKNHAFAWAERFIEHARSLPTRQKKVWNLYAFPEGRDALVRVEKRFGISCRSRIDLGELHFLSGNYAAAKRYFNQALQLSPNDENAQQKLTYLQKCNEVRWAVAPQLPKGHVVTAIAPITLNGKKLWVITFGQAETNPPSEMLGFNSAKIKYATDLRLAVFSEAAGAWPKLQVINLEVGPTLQGSFTKHHQIFAEDLTGDTQPEVVIIQMGGDSGGDRDYVQVFKGRSNRFNRIYNEAGQLSSWFEDLNHDGKVEIGSFHERGAELCHADMPRWPSIYAYKKGRYVLSDNDFPQEFQKWPTELRSLLKRCPTDYDLWHHLGKAYETQKQFKSAMQAYRRAEVLLKKITTNDKDRFYKNRLRGVRADIKVLRHRVKMS